MKKRRDESSAGKGEGRHYTRERERVS